MKNKIINKLMQIIISTVIIGMFMASVHAEPVGPTATHVSNSTRTIATNTSFNESTGGGYIYTYTFDAVEQNQRWKAYVGNITGTLTLDDANSYTIYQWDLGTVTGEVYATRNSSTVSWTNMNCSWGVTSNSTNRTISQQEDTAMQHTRMDNITATFDNRSHRTFDVGETTIPANDCYSVYPNVNDAAQSANFSEVIMYDGTTITNGKVVYAALIENDLAGYLTGQTYDFQMLLPEIGTDTWSSSTPYYFYVELA